jgi:hypothetical protein
MMSRIAGSIKSGLSAQTTPEDRLVTGMTMNFDYFRL